jgi:hypothetical protein
MPPDDRDDDLDDRPRRARRARDDRDDEHDDRPRRRRRRDDDDDEEGDATGGLIPYKNGMALAAYYCAVVSLIPLIGHVLGSLAVVFGILGLKHKSRHPKHGGTAHAIVGIVLGAITTLGYWILTVLLFTGFWK